MNEWRILDERGDVIFVDAERRDAWRANPANRALARVGHDVIGEARVSTALRVLADWHDFPWETIILGGPWNVWCRQYINREAAERGHRDAWERLNLGLAPSPEDEPDTDLSGTPDE